MNNKSRKTARDLIQNHGWKELGIIHEMPGPLFWGKVVEILYEDMDGNLCQCRARDISCDAFTPEHFVAMNGPAKGNWMENVVAWRPVE